MVATYLMAHHSVETTPSRSTVVDVAIAALYMKGPVVVVVVGCSVYFLHDFVVVESPLVAHKPAWR